MVLYIASTMSAIAVVETYALQNNKWVTGGSLWHGGNMCTFLNILALLSTVYDTAAMKIQGQKSYSTWCFLSKMRLFVYAWRIIGLKACITGYIVVHLASQCCCCVAEDWTHAATNNLVRVHWIIWSTATLLNHRLFHFMCTVGVSRLPLMQTHIFQKDACLLLCFLSLYA
jgi:hypothetical protein